MRVDGSRVGRCEGAHWRVRAGSTARRISLSSCIPATPQRAAECVVYYAMKSPSWKPSRGGPAPVRGNGRRNLRVVCSKKHAKSTSAHHLSTPQHTSCQRLPNVLSRMHGAVHHFSNRTGNSHMLGRHLGDALHYGIPTVQNRLRRLKKNQFLVDGRKHLKKNYLRFAVAGRRR